jgi:hypothetical protein
MSEWGRYTLTITKGTEVIKVVEYHNMSGTAMMDEAFSWRIKYPMSEGYAIEW